MPFITMIEVFLYNIIYDAGSIEFRVIKIYTHNARIAISKSYKTRNI